MLPHVANTLGIVVFQRIQSATGYIVSGKNERENYSTYITWDVGKVYPPNIV